jgi:hypothetical protein
MMDWKPLASFVLEAEDSRTVTYDTRTGPGLTANPALSYVWIDPGMAEVQRRGYEDALGVALAVRPQPTSRLRRAAARPPTVPDSKDISSYRRLQHGLLCLPAFRPPGEAFRRRLEGQCENRA